MAYNFSHDFWSAPQETPEEMERFWASISGGNALAGSQSQHRGMGTGSTTSYQAYPQSAFAAAPPQTLAGAMGHRGVANGNTSSYLPQPQRASACHPPVAQTSLAGPLGQHRGVGTGSPSGYLAQPQRASVCHPPAVQNSHVGPLGQDCGMGIGSTSSYQPYPQRVFPAVPPQALTGAPGQHLGMVAGSTTSYHGYPQTASAPGFLHPGQGLRGGFVAQHAPRRAPPPAGVVASPTSEVIDLTGDDDLVAGTNPGSTTSYQAPPRRDSSSPIDLTALPDDEPTLATASTDSSTKGKKRTRESESSSSSPSPRKHSRLDSTAGESQSLPGSSASDPLSVDDMPVVASAPAASSTVKRPSLRKIAESLKHPYLLGTFWPKQLAQNDRLRPTRPPIDFSLPEGVSHVHNVWTPPRKGKSKRKALRGKKKGEAAASATGSSSSPPILAAKSAESVESELAAPATPGSERDAEEATPEPVAPPQEALSGAAAVEDAAAVYEFEFDEPEPAGIPDDGDLILEREDGTTVVVNRDVDTQYAAESASSEREETEEDLVARLQAEFDLEAPAAEAAEPPSEGSIAAESEEKEAQATTATDSAVEIVDAAESDFSDEDFDLWGGEFPENLS